MTGHARRLQMRIAYSHDSSSVLRSARGAGLPAFFQQR